MLDRRACQECQNEFSPSRYTSKFCSVKCRKEFNNRRAMRGAILYDAFMGHRYDRKAAADAGMDWKFICRIGEMFHAQDEAEGRVSARPVKEVMEDYGCQVNARISRCR